MPRGVESSGNSDYFIDTSIKQMKGSDLSSGFFRIEDTMDEKKCVKVIKVDSEFKKIVLDVLAFFRIVHKPVYKSAKELSDLGVFKSQSTLSESAQILAIMSLAEELKTGVPSGSVLDRYNEAEKNNFIEMIENIALIGLSKNKHDKNFSFVDNLIRNECAGKPADTKIQKIYFNGINISTGRQDTEQLVNHLFIAENPVEALDALHLSQKTLLEVALFINKNRHKLRIFDDHPLMQRAIAIICESDIQLAENALNRHRQLYQLQKIPSDFQPPKEVVCGMKTSIDLEQLRNARGNVKVKREELPPEATLQAWNQLKENLKKKVENHPTEALNALSSYATTWDAVWLGCLGDSHLSNLLATSGDNVTLTEAKFRAVLSNILALDNTPKENQFFTELEEALIKTTMTIKNCPTGKNEAIDLTYARLSTKYHYNTKLLDSTEEKPFHFVTNVVQNIISNQFRGEHPPLLQQLTGRYSIPQTAHQVLYIKNLIGNVVGLEHELALDRTGILSDALINKTREEVLAVFFEHVTPKTMARELMRVVNTDLDKNSAIISPLIASSEFWDLQDDELSYTLNERGSIELLQKVGYLTIEPEPA